MYMKLILCIICTLRHPEVFGTNIQSLIPNSTTVRPDRIPSNVVQRKHTTSATTARAKSFMLNDNLAEPGTNTLYTHPTPRSYTHILQTWSLTDHRVLYIEDLLRNNLGASFHDPRIMNYTIVGFLPRHLALYVVGNKATILKMDMNSFFLLDSHTLPQIKSPGSMCQSKRPCYESTEISLLSTMPNEQMVWYCYVHMYHFADRPSQPHESGCMVPQHGNLAEPVMQWENPHFNSLDPSVPASILNAADGFTYISSFTPDYLRIFRTRMPDWNGNMNWTGALVTDKNGVYIAEPAEVLLTFETTNEVYFVLQESSIDGQKTFESNVASSNLESPNQSTMAPRVIRLCKGDRGGLPFVSDRKFGTFAKADLVCHSVDPSGQSFAYTRLRAAHWNNATQKLYAVFTTERWAPTGSALCVYDKTDIEAAFKGPLVSSGLEKAGTQRKPIKNTFPSICERFNSQNLTSEELSIGRRLSLTFPKRYNPIEPRYKRAIFVQSGVQWIHLQAYDLPALPKHYHFGNPVLATVVWLGTRKALERIVVYEPSGSGAVTKPDPVVCKLNELHVGQSLNVLAQQNLMTHADTTWAADEAALPSLRQLSYLDYHHWRTAFRRDEQHGTPGTTEEEINRFSIQLSKLYIITNRQVLWLPLSDCSRYVTFDQCIASRDPHCGWSWHEARCVDGYEVTPSLTTNWFNTFSPSIDRRRLANTQCPMDQQNPGIKNSNAWSEWYICRMVDLEQIAPSNQEQLSSIKQILGQSEGFCRCRVCLSREDCVFGTQEVTNCTRFDRNWLPWSTWSRCDSSRGFQFRERLCPHNAMCVGASKEQRPCENRFPFVDDPSSVNNYVKTSETMTAKSTKQNIAFLTDGIGVILLLLVALLFLLLGCLISTMVFCLCPTFCIRFDRNAVCASATPPCAKNEFWCKKRFASDNITENPASSLDTSWNLKDSSQTSRSIEKPLLSPRPPHRQLKLPPRRVRPFKIRFNGDLAKPYSSSSQHFLPWSALLSPASNFSGPSTASSLLKDNFPFDNLPDQTYDTQEEMLSSTNSKELTENSVASIPSYGNPDSIMDESTVPCVFYHNNQPVSSAVSRDEAQTRQLSTATD